MDLSNSLTSLNQVNTKILKNLSDIIANLLVILSRKEKYIIEKRFALNQPGRETLEKIGQHFNVTRERIRQIEFNALTKLQRHACNTTLNLINKLAENIIMQHEGVVEEKKLLSQLLQQIQSQKPEVDINNICLSLSLDQGLLKNFNTIFYKPYWKLITVSKSQIQEISDKAIRILEKTNNVMTLKELVIQIQSAIGSFKPNPQFIQSVLEIHKRIKFVSEGAGLIEWRNINPKTLRDKIFYMLRKTKNPLHFVEISNKITETHFDNKIVNIQAVHNELIRNPQFVLIGRGIYALKEWGYEKGTVSDVIKQILNKNKKPMAQEKIIEAVLKRRQVKKITILLNLKNKPEFQKVGRQMYQLA